MKRQPGLEFQWMGSGITPQQREGVESLVRALRYYARTKDPGYALHALKLEGARRPNHTSLGGHVPPMPAPRPPGRST